MVQRENHLQSGWLLPLCWHSELPLLGQSQRGGGPPPFHPAPRSTPDPVWRPDHARAWAWMSGKACITSGARQAWDLPRPAPGPLAEHSPAGCRPLPRGSLSDLAAYSPAFGSGAACSALGCDLGCRQGHLTFPRRGTSSVCRPVPAGASRRA